MLKSNLTNFLRERKQQNAEINSVSTIRDKSEEIQETCKEHKVDILYAFGSVLLDSFSEESDIDLLVTFEKATSPVHLHNISILKKSWKRS